MQAKMIRAFLVFLVLFIVIIAIAWLIAPHWSLSGSGTTGDRIALIHLEGMITGAASGGGLLSGETLASSVSLCDRLYQARDDDSIKAVLLRVNSPGGSAAASDEIYHAVKAVSEKKPVVVSMGDVAASGGYYVSSAASYIYANGATLTGSIGVVFNLINWEEAADKLGIKDVTLTAGKYKDIGTPWREMTDEERGMLSELMTEVHNQFIAAVAAGRDTLDEARVRELATGMIYTGEQAVDLGLVDELGGLEAAKVKARELAQLSADAPVEDYSRPSFWDEFFSIRVGQPDAMKVLKRLSADPLMQLSQGLYLSTTLRDLIVR
jgi:protease-4